MRALRWACAQISLVEASVPKHFFSLTYINQSSSIFFCIRISITKLFYQPFTVLLQFDGIVSYLLHYLGLLSLMEGIFYCCIFIWLLLLSLSCCCCRLSSCFSQYHCCFTTPLESAVFFDGGRWRQQWAMAAAVSDGGGDGSSVGKFWWRWAWQ